MVSEPKAHQQQQGKQAKNKVAATAADVSTNGAGYTFKIQRTSYATFSIHFFGRSDTGPSPAAECVSETPTASDPSPSPLALAAANASRKRARSEETDSPATPAAQEQFDLHALKTYGRASFSINS